MGRESGRFGASVSWLLTETARFTAAKNYQGQDFAEHVKIEFRLQQYSLTGKTPDSLYDFRGFVCLRWWFQSAFVMPIKTWSLLQRECVAGKTACHQFPCFILICTDNARVGIR